MADVSAAQEATVVAGVDCHSRTHQAVALDDRGRRLGGRAFPATQAGSTQLLGWLRRFGAVQAVGVESTGAYGAGLTRALRAAGLRVVEVNQPRAHTRHRRGKSDAIDAEAAARKVRKVVSGEATAVPKDTTGTVEAIRLLRTARASAVKARAAALTQLGELLVTAPAALREQGPGETLRGQAAGCARLRPDDTRLAEPLQAAQLALRRLARRSHDLDGEMAELDRHLTALVAVAAPRTRALLGVGTGHAGQLLVTAGQNLSRLRSAAASARLCGAAPLPASSGKTVRHRLNPGGDRAANSALHLLAVVRLRSCERTRAYAARRTAEGRSKKEILRCLKRSIAREV
jgi:transposase